MSQNLKKLFIGFGLFSFALILFVTGAKDVFWNAVALGGLMIYFWVFEVIPIYITALLPMILASPLGLLDKTDLANSYGDGNVYLFFGGFILALGLEKWKVHEQVARGIIGENDFIEIFLNPSLSSCEQRDVKGMYKKARAGQIADFTGVNAPFEIPENAQLEIHTDTENVETSLQQILDNILPILLLA